METTKKLCAVILVLGLLIVNQAYACTAWPTVILVVTPNPITNGHSTTLDGSDSYDYYGDTIVKYEFDFEYNGTFSADYTETSSNHPDGAFDGITTHTYNRAGTHTAALRVTDNGTPPLNYGTGTCAVYVRPIYVPDDNDTIQAAINHAVNENTVAVRPGTYRGSGNRDLDFNGKNITVCGTDPNDWEVIAKTIIDCNGTRANPYRGFCFDDANEDNDSIVAGFTITNGYGKYIDAPLYNYVGGAIYCTGSSPTIKNCLITKNMNDTDNYDVQAGGIACYNNANPKIINCIITENGGTYSSYGEGIMCSYSSPAITGCVIAKNSLYSAGIYSYEGAPRLPTAR